MFTFLVFLVFISIVYRFWNIQIRQTEKFKTLSEQNRIRLITLKAPRGEILDSKGRVMVKNRTVFVVSVNDMGSDDKTIEAAKKIDEFLKLPAEDFKKIIKTIETPGRRRFEPVRMMEDVPKELVARIEENRQDLDGVMVGLEPIRQYVYFDKSPIAPHILGYTGIIDENQWNSNKDKYLELNYLPTDRIGKTGLEKQYELYLRGQDGARQMEVDSEFRPVRPLETVQPVAGNNLSLTIDADLQHTAEKALSSAMSKVRKKYPNAKAGALVAIDVRTGAVLAMASRPGFDPNMFSRKITQKEADTMFTVKDFPASINRALYGYAPGSTYKMVTAIAGLESGKISPSTTIYDRGYFRVGNRPFSCWLKSGHGNVNLSKALEVSCNTYFYDTGNQIGINTIAKYANELGLGNYTNIDLPDEKKGIRPTPERKREIKESYYNAVIPQILNSIESSYNKKIAKAKSKKEKERLEKEKKQKINSKKAELEWSKNYEMDWHQYETVISAIGQGDNNYSPLQLANYAAAIATKGVRYEPFIVDHITSMDGKEIFKHKTVKFPKANISTRTFDLIRDGMYQVTHGSKGTAASVFRNFPIPVAGKTGTAQQNKKENNALFVGFAPYDKPQIAFACIIEQGGHGGETAAPAVRKVLAKYFNVKVPDISGSGGD